MNSATFLQIFLLINVFIIGALAATAIRHAYAHFRPAKHDAEKRVIPQGGHIPPAMREQLLKNAEESFMTILDRSGKQLEHDLQTTTVALNKQLEKLGSEIVTSETERFHTILQDLRAQAETIVTSAQAEISVHQSDIKVQLTESMEVEKKRLIEQIDTKLADAVASFLTETLQHNIDLGAQSGYLTSLLEEHKDELIKGIKDEN
jgi:uncharacterized membrane protein